MKTRRACDPEGPGLRGLITSNVVRRGRVAARIGGDGDDERACQGPGSRASAGPARRDGATAGTRCSCMPRRPTSTRWRSRTFAPTGAARDPGAPRLAGYKSRTFNVTGATRIVQRVICVGGDGRKSCSARGHNFLRTYEAEVRIADVLAPSASILGDTPLGGGAWVGGTQPLNYDASDNVGVRAGRRDRRRP